MQPGNKLTIESLSDDWCDKDHVMLHACFQLLKDCVEKEELLSGHTDWDADDKHRKTKAELEALYNWWLERIKAGEGGSLPIEDQNKEDDQMLHRLINIRWALWT